MPINVTSILALIFALGATVVLFIFVLSKKRYDRLPKFLKIVADILNFKELYLEKVLRALYVFATMLCICLGFFMLFSGVYHPFINKFTSFAGYGLLVMFVGPIVVRLAYELLLMFILLVKNVMEINNKLSCKCEKKAEPVVEEKPVEPKFVFCSQCGTRYDANKGGCPNCK